MANFGENIISLQDEKLCRDRLGSLTQKVRHKLGPWPASPAACSGLQHSDHPSGAVARLADGLQAVLQKNLVTRARGAGCRLGLSVWQASWTAPALGMYLCGLLLLVCLEPSSLPLSQTLRGRDQMTTPRIPAGPPPRARNRRAWRAAGLDSDCPPSGLSPAAGGLLSCLVACS